MPMRRGRATPVRIRSNRAGQPVVLMRATHRLASLSALTAPDFASATHVTIPRRGRRHGLIDDPLRQQGLTRHVIASVPTAAAGLDVVRRTDFIAVVGGRLVRDDPRVVERPVPLELPPLSAVLSWHRRNDSDAEHLWLRELAGAALSAVFEGLV